MDSLIREVNGLFKSHDSMGMQVAVEAWVPYAGAGGGGAGANTMRVCGAIRALALVWQTSCTEYTAQAAKGIVLNGNRNASKSEVQSGVQKLLGLSKVPRPNHAADGLLLAIAHTMRQESSALVTSHSIVRKKTV